MGFAARGSRFAIALTGANRPDSVATAGVTASIDRGNVGSADDCRRTVNEVIDRHGRLDVLVNNAGITSDKSVTKMTDEDWYKVIAVNLSGAGVRLGHLLASTLDLGLPTGALRT